MSSASRLAAELGGFLILKVAEEESSARTEIGASSLQPLEEQLLVADVLAGVNLCSGLELSPRQRSTGFGGLILEAMPLVPPASTRIEPAFF